MIKELNIRMLTEQYQNVAERCYCSPLSSFYLNLTSCPPLVTPTFDHLFTDMLTSMAVFTRIFSPVYKILHNKVYLYNIPIDSLSAKLTSHSTQPEHHGISPYCRRHTGSWGLSRQTIRLASFQHRIWHRPVCLTARKFTQGRHLAPQCRPHAA